MSIDSVNCMHQFGNLAFWQVVVSMCLLKHLHLRTIIAFSVCVASQNWSYYTYTEASAVLEYNLKNLLFKLAILIIQNWWTQQNREQRLERILVVRWSVHINSQLGVLVKMTTMQGSIPTTSTGIRWKYFTTITFAQYTIGCGKSWRTDHCVTCCSKLDTFQSFFSSCLQSAI